MRDVGFYRLCQNVACVRAVPAVIVAAPRPRCPTAPARLVLDRSWPAPEMERRCSRDTHKSVAALLRARRGWPCAASAWRCGSVRDLASHCGFIYPRLPPRYATPSLLRAHSTRRAVGCCAPTRAFHPHPRVERHPAHPFERLCALLAADASKFPEREMAVPALQILYGVLLVCRVCVTQ